ncbi:MAG: hypothetical protein H7Y86_20195 [Rhizobacter sp.]|nr:hypothetical protein [Ferruginibacter sp.]
MEAAKDDFLTHLGLVEYWKEHTGIRYAKYNTVYSKTNVATKTIYGVFINENASDEMLLFKALYSNNYEVMAKDVKGNATNEEVTAHIEKYKSEKDV